jgi:hypothetical protein
VADNTNKLALEAFKHFAQNEQALGFEKLLATIASVSTEAAQPVTLTNSDFFRAIRPLYDCDESARIAVELSASEYRAVLALAAARLEPKEAQVESGAKPGAAKLLADLHEREREHAMSNSEEDRQYAAGIRDAMTAFALAVLSSAPSRSSERRAATSLVCSQPRRPDMDATKKMVDAPHPDLRDASFCYASGDDGAGAYLVKGWAALVARITEDCGDEILEVLADIAEWSNDGKGRPYHCGCSFEDGYMTVYRLIDLSTPTAADAPESAVQPDPQASANAAIDAAARKLPEEVKEILRVGGGLTAFLGEQQYASSVIRKGLVADVQRWEKALRGFYSWLRVALAASQSTPMGTLPDHPISSMDWSPLEKAAIATWGRTIREETHAPVEAKALADAICLDVAELPDRSSPEDWPEAMLVTAAELMEIVVRNLALFASEPAPEQVVAP